MRKSCYRETNGGQRGALVRCDDINSLGSDIEGVHRQDKAELREGTDRANFRLLQVPADWLVI